jgi:hypothetical protein
LTGARASPNDSRVSKASATQPEHAAHPAYQLFMLVLCLFALGILAARTAARLAPETAGILDLADRGVCVIFLVDFAVSLWRAPDRWRYFSRWGWLDLLSSVPMVSFACCACCAARARPASSRARSCAGAPRAPSSRRRCSRSC